MEKQKQAYIYAALVIAFWATVASAFKFSLRYLDALQLVLYSTLTSVIVLFAILLAQKKLPLLKKQTGKDIAGSAMLGFLSPFLYYIVLFLAYSRLQAQEAQPLNQIWIILLPILSIFILGQKIGAKSIIALLLGLVGVVIISTRGDILGLGFTDGLGVALALGSAFIWSLFWIYNVKDRRDEVVKLFLNFCFGLAFVLLVSILFSSLFVNSASGLFWAAYVGIFEMGLTFVLWLKALSLSKTTAQVSVLIYLVPFFSLVIINIFVREAILPSTIIGLLFIVAGILMQQYPGRGKEGSKRKLGTK